MAKIEAVIDINSTIDNVWNIISDIDNEPKFWKGTKEVNDLRINRSFNFCSNWNFIRYG